MNLTIEIPDERAARFRRVAQGRGLTVDRWMLELAEHEAQAAAVSEASPKPTLAEVFAKVRGLADDVEFQSRSVSPVVTSFYERLSARHECPVRDYSQPAGPAGQWLD